MADRTIEELDEAESLQLISAGGIGRIAYQSRFPEIAAVLPVDYQVARRSDRVPHRPAQRAG